MNRQIFTDLLEMKEFKAVKSILEDMDTATIAELLGELKEKERREAFGLIETPKKEKVFAQLDDDMQSCLAKTFTEKDGQNTREVQEKQYFDTSVLIHAKNRIGWLLFLMLSATITQTIIAHYESAFAAVPLLVSFIPMLTDTGGNCGSQSSTLIIRGIALDEIGFRDIFKVMFKEVRVALMVSLGLAAVNGIYILLRYLNRNFSDGYDFHGKIDWMCASFVCREVSSGPGNYGSAVNYNHCRCRFDYDILYHSNKIIGCSLR